MALRKAVRVPRTLDEFPRMERSLRDNFTNRCGGAR